MTEYEKHVVDLQPLLRLAQNGPIDARFGENCITMRQIISMARSLSSRLTRDCVAGRMDDFDEAVITHFAHEFGEIAEELWAVIPRNHQMAAE